MSMPLSCFFFCIDHTLSNFSRLCVFWLFWQFFARFFCQRNLSPFALLPIPQKRRPFGMPMNIRSAFRKKSAQLNSQLGAFGSPCWTRTNDPAVNSRMLYHSVFGNPKTIILGYNYTAILVCGKAFSKNCL